MKTSLSASSPAAAAATKPELKSEAARLPRFFQVRTAKADASGPTSPKSAKPRDLADRLKQR